ncbi:hypothetical protein [Actinoplanes sp. HUAS TT8]|uniref:hypothetical protein n=1 Tax=Actinoplanes sp. HUAS TT8 TaxID=3447453 RepID=UPI003F5244F3
MTDQFEQLFADLRADTIPRILPPGSEAARGTVRRRRTRRTAMTGVGLVAVVAAGAALALPSPPQQADPASGQLSQETLDDFAGRAARQLGSYDGTVTAFAGQVLTTKRVPGDYEVALVCAGVAGMVNLTVAGIDQPVSCGTQLTTIHVPVTVTESNPEVTIDVAPDAVAAGRYGLAFSVRMTDGAKGDLTGDAQEAVGTSNDNGGGAAFLDGVIGIQDDSVGAGRYTLALACAGAGSVTVKVGNQKMHEDGSEPIKTYQRDCDGTAAEFDITLPPGTTGATIDALPSGDAENQAAVAYRWEPR